MAQFLIQCNSAHFYKVINTITSFNLFWRIIMKSKFIFLAAFTLFITYFISCDNNSKPKSSREDLELIIQNQAQALLQNNLSMFSAGGNSASVREGGPMNFWFYPPWMYYSLTASSGTVSNDSTSADPTIMYTDTNYYDPASGYWIYSFKDTTFESTMRYKFMPHDNDGYPTAETDQYLFDANYSGHFEDSYWGIGYTYVGQSDYQISGLKDWMDTLKIGTIIYNGNSQSHYTQNFSNDTSVTFSFDEVVDHVTMSENDCAPHSGSSEFQMIQDATPDSFTFAYRFDDSTSFDMPFEDFSYYGKTIYTEDGVRFILDGEEYFYEIDCDSGYVITGGAPANGKTSSVPRLARRK